MLVIFAHNSVWCCWEMLRYHMLSFDIKIDSSKLVSKLREVRICRFFFSTVCPKTFHCYQLKKGFLSRLAGTNTNPLWFSLSSHFVFRCNHGVCAPKGEAYTCKCSEGYQGQYCDRQQEPPACRGQRCGHGECRVSESGEPVCHCEPGYSGPTCDKGESGRSQSLWNIYNIKTMSDSYFFILGIINYWKQEEKNTYTFRFL